MTQQFHSQNPDFEQTVRNSFAKQGLLRHLEAQLMTVQPGHVSITLPYSASVTQQHGFFHAGAVTTIVDTACGYAALTLMPPHSDVLTIEYKVNFVSPAQGDYVIARAQVLKPGRTVTVCQGDVFGVFKGQETLCSTMLATMIYRPVAM